MHSRRVRAVGLASSDNDDKDPEVEFAFFQKTSPEERYRVLAAESAYLKKSTRRLPKSELELMESLTVPCSVRVVREAPSPTSRGGASLVAAVAVRPLAFWENMLAGAISRSMAQTVMHPANTMKTILQTSRGKVNILELLQPRNFRRLTNGAGANFLLSVPHGAVNFAVLEFVRTKLARVVESTPVLAENAERIGPTLDFMSSAISTIACSVVSTPQMVITDNIMAGNYPNLASAVKGLASGRGVAGFYHGWWPGLVGKIPSYALTWTFFQQLKRVRDKVTGRPATNFENTVMGCIASGTCVCIMIPMDTIKTRLVTQTSAMAADRVYKGIIDCAVRTVREEGVKALYRGLTPRLISVVPMIGIQFGVYEFMRKSMIRRQAEMSHPSKSRKPTDHFFHYGFHEALQEAAMEVAASPEHPYPAPQFLRRVYTKSLKNLKHAQKARETRQ